jgi:hypothetical protein
MAFAPELENYWARFDIVAWICSFVCYMLALFLRAISAFVRDTFLVASFRIDSKCFIIIIGIHSIHYSCPCSPSKRKNCQ